jgi:tricorn protease
MQIASTQAHTGSVLSAAILVIAAAFGFAGATPAHAKPGYLRYPDIQGDRVAFCAEGDLWIAPVAGGEARRITSHAGDEVLPKFSPDGKWIAFAGDYDGNQDLFVMPADGGEPVRLTWHPGPDAPLDWTSDGKEILFPELA